jgi:acetyl-CoA carboxylase beta subunit
MVLEWHMSLEDRQLAPILRDADAFGPIRAERLAEDHARQRVELETLLRRVEQAADTPELVRRTRGLVEAVRADIAYEDTAYLGEGLLRDDIVVNDGAFGG